MKGILLAGGTGSRLYPMTAVVNKQLLPVYDKPIVHYPLSTLMLAGINEILIISSAEHLPLYQKLFGDGSQLGLKLSYIVQDRPEGIAQAYILAEDFLKGEPSCLILGDNIYFGHGLPNKLMKAAELKSGGLVFAYWVKDPERYGVVEFDKKGVAHSICEKPKNPKSNYAIPGIYFYDGDVVKHAKKLKPSARGELEITDLHSIYLKSGNLHVEPFGRGTAWLDVGTPEALLQAANFVHTIDERQGLKIACLEEVAFYKGFITRAELATLAKNYHNDYREYLARVADSKEYRIQLSSDLIC